MFATLNPPINAVRTKVDPPGIDTVNCIPRILIETSAAFISAFFSGRGRHAPGFLHHLITPRVVGIYHAGHRPEDR
jgi:hypothetical protein